MGYSIPVFSNRSSAAVVFILQTKNALFKQSPLAASLWRRHAITCCSSSDFSKTLFVFRFANEEPQRNVFATDCSVPPTMPTCNLQRFHC